MSIRNYDQALYPFKSNWVTINNNHIHFIDEGKGDVILFCHPPFASSFMYRNMIPALSKEFRCIALDFPGFGLSVAAPDYIPTVRAQAIIVEDLLKHLQISSVYFIMQEVGGHSGIMVFLKHPGWLKGIILTDTIIFPVSQYPRIRFMLKIVNSAVFNFFNSHFNLFIKIFTTSGIKKRKMTREERETYLQMFSARQIRRTSINMLYQLNEDEKLMNQIQNSFETIFNNLPSLIIYGDKDPLTKLGVPARVKSIMKNAELYFIEGEAHFPHEGAPEQMSKLIGDWICRSEG